MGKCTYLHSRNSRVVLIRHCNRTIHHHKRILIRTSFRITAIRSQKEYHHARLVNHAHTSFGLSARECEQPLSNIIQIHVGVSYDVGKIPWRSASDLCRTGRIKRRRKSWNFSLKNSTPLRQYSILKFFF